MHKQEVLFRISLFSGIIMLLLGGYMLNGNLFSEGFTYGRNGGGGTGTITGWGVVCIGIVTLLLSVMVYFGWKNDVKKHDAMLAEENSAIQKKIQKEEKRKKRAAYLKKYGKH